MTPITQEDAIRLPLLSDADIEQRVTDLVGRANIRQLWLLFLDGDGVQLPLMIPIGGLPSNPSDDETATVVANIGEVMLEIGATAVVMVWERYGASTLTAQDAAWTRCLRAACAAQGVTLRAMLLSHRTGVRWIPQDDYTLREVAP